jgi:hypothetical protein
MRTPHTIHLTNSTALHVAQTPMYSDTVVFIDESGDANLTNVDPRFPILNLVCVLVQKTHYFNAVVPGLSRLKQRFFQTDDVVLHDSDLRRMQGACSLLRTPDTQAACQAAISDWISALEFQIITACIDKEALVRRYAHPFDPYDLAIRFCLERMSQWLASRMPRGHITQICFESRGKRQDRQADLEFNAILAKQSRLGTTSTDFSTHPMEALFIPKHANVAGLQLADLIARPLARHCLNVDSQQPVMKILQPKLYAHKIFPHTGRLNQFTAGKTRLSPAAKGSQAP